MEGRRFKPCGLTPNPAAHQQSSCVMSLRRVTLFQLQLNLKQTRKSTRGRKNFQQKGGRRWNVSKVKRKISGRNKYSLKNCLRIENASEEAKGCTCYALLASSRRKYLSYRDNSSLQSSVPQRKQGLYSALVQDRILS